MRYRILKHGIYSDLIEANKDKLKCPECRSVKVYKIFDVDETNIFANDYSFSFKCIRCGCVFLKMEEQKNESI